MYKTITPAEIYGIFDTGRSYGGLGLHYTIDDLVRLAKRDNNTVRPYLYVNPLQGKHIPASPEKIMDVCYQIATLINDAYSNERLYVIGFAETATGIASAISHYLNNVVFYQNTTREYKENEDVLYFTESHSHATDQNLRVSGLQDHIGEVERIIFIDDEVTTGNTICKLIDVIKQTFGENDIHFSIASVLNSMTKERVSHLEEEGIDCLFLAQLPFEYKKESILDIRYEPFRDISVVSDDPIDAEILEYEAAVDPRTFCRFAEYDDENESFSKKVIAALGNDHYKDMLILGTEECMYPSICLGHMISESGLADSVRVHATTRSPIIASGEPDYPLHHRYQLRSLYDRDRKTFIYNLERYDKVILVTDADQLAEGASDLVTALKNAGNDNILIAKWKYR